MNFVYNWIVRHLRNKIKGNKGDSIHMNSKDKDSSQLPDRKWWNGHIDEIVRPKVTFAISAWTDLLGFGSCLDNIGWNLNHYERHFRTIARIESFRESASRFGGPNSTYFVLNDGIGMTRDIPEEPVPLPTLWLALFVCIRRHYLWNKRDKAARFPGVRTVIAAGQRLVDPAWVDGLSTKPRGFDIRKPSIIRIGDVPEPPRGPNINRIALYTPREFQLNLAFAKAYTLDAMGSRHGLKGSHIFIDESLVRLLKFRLDGSSRYEPDCWRYRVSYGSGKNSLLLVLEQGNASGAEHAARYSIILHLILPKLQTRWGTTKVYRVIKTTRHAVGYLDKETINLN